MTRTPTPPTFVSGVFAAFPDQWTLTFSEPITTDNPPFNPKVWWTKRLLVKKFADTVSIGFGKVVLRSPAFGPLDDHVGYDGGPPHWSDAQGDHIEPFVHTLPS